MPYLALASDYDGTLATEGKVDRKTLVALEHLRQSGRKIILITGRELEELLQVFPQINLCDLVVAENGALLYNPATGSETILGEPPPKAFIEALRSQGVQPLSVGRVILATWQPHENTVIDTIRDFGLNLEVIFNKKAVMLLPTGVDKASGLLIALKELGLYPNQTVGIGDAENDLAFLKLCHYSVAVANALPSLKKQVTLVTNESRGAGVCELIDKIITSDNIF